MHHSMHGCEWPQDLACDYKYRYVYTHLSEATALLFKFIIALKEKYTRDIARL